MSVGRALGMHVRTRTIGIVHEGALDIQINLSLVAMRGQVLPRSSCALVWVCLFAAQQKRPYDRSVGGGEQSMDTKTNRRCDASRR